MTKELKQYLTKKFWLEAQYGVVSEVAQACKVSRQFVHGVFWGRKTSARVKMALVERGAPIGDRRSERQKRARREKATA
jgi:hypothetical protein